MGLDYDPVALSIALLAVAGIAFSIISLAKILAGRNVAGSGMRGCNG